MLNLRLTKTIAALQVVGGILGIVTGVYGIVTILMEKDPRLALNLALILGYTIPFFVAAIAGVLLWRGKLAGLWLSLVIQALQIPHVALSNFAYHFVVGATIPLVIEPSSLSIAFDFGTSIRVSGGVLPQDGAPEVIALNLLALLICGFLFYQRKRVIGRDGAPL